MRESPLLPDARRVWGASRPTQIAQTTARTVRDEDECAREHARVKREEGVDARARGRTQRPRERPDACGGWLRESPLSSDARRVGARRAPPSWRKRQCTLEHTLRARRESGSAGEQRERERGRERQDNACAGMVASVACRLPRDTGGGPRTAPRGAEREPGTTPPRSRRNNEDKTVPP